MAKLYVGLSGFSYPEWKGEELFYPPKLKPADFLQFYATRYNTVETVGTFTHMPSAASVAKWIDVTSDGFRVSPKMHQTVTHRCRLKPTGFEVLHSFAEAIQPAEQAGKLGPILVQLPPNLKRDDTLLAAFLAEIPVRETLRWAIEFRSATWNVPEVEAALRERGIGWVAADTDDADAERRDTASFHYVRLRRLAYSDEQLQGWAAYFRSRIAAGQDCYVYCRHESVDAPWRWADRLNELVT